MSGQFELERNEIGLNSGRRGKILRRRVLKDELGRRLRGGVLRDELKCKRKDGQSEMKANPKEAKTLGSNTIQI